MAVGRKHIVAMLRGADRVASIDKNTFEVGLATPVLLKLTKDGLNINEGKRTVPFKEAPSYIKGLLNMSSTDTVKWDRNERRRNLTVLMKLYGDRVVPKSRKEGSFQIDPEKPSTVNLSTTGCVRIQWNDDNDNVYGFDDVVKHMSEYGSGFQPNDTLTGQATEREQVETKPKKKKKGKKGKKAKPAPTPEPTPTPEPVLCHEKAYWEHNISKLLLITSPKEDVREIQEHYTRISKKKYEKRKAKGIKSVRRNVKPADIPNGPTKPQPPVTDPVVDKPAPKRGKKKASGPAKPRTPRGTGLGVGGKPLDAKKRKAAAKAINGLRHTQAIRLLISEYDADNPTIEELTDQENKVVQRVRRAMLREAKAKAGA